MAIFDGVSAKVTGSAVTSVTTPNVTTQSSNSLVVLFGHWGTETFSTIADNKSNSFAIIQSEANASSHKSRLYYKENAAGGSNHNATLTLTGSGAPTLYFYEGLGLALSGSLDQSDVRDDTSSPFTLAAGLTTMQADELLFTATGGNSSSPSATHAESGLPSSTVHQELTNGSSEWTGAIATDIVSSTGTYNPSWTENGSSSNHVWLATFKGANGPAINSQPTDQTAADGATAAFTVSATSSGGALVYDWEERSPGGAWTNVGTNSNTYTTGTLTRATDSGKDIRCNVSDDNGTTTTNVVSLTVTKIPTSFTDGDGMVIGDSYVGEGMVGAPEFSGGITATFLQTDGADTLSGDATLAIAASATITDGADTTSSAAALAIVADSALTDASDTITAAAGVGIAGSSTLTDDADTVSGAATLGIAGSTAITDDADTLTCAGALGIVGSCGPTDDSDTSGATGALGIIANLAITEDSDTLASAAGSPQTIADANLIDGNDSISASAALAISASLTITETGDSASIAATVAISASATVSEQGDSISSACTLANQASCAIVDGSDTTSAAATLAIVANLAVSDGADSLSADANTGAPITASATLTDGNDTLSASATLPGSTTTEPSTPGSSGRITRRKYPRSIWEPPPEPLPVIAANAELMDGDDGCFAIATLGPSPMKQRNDLALRLLFLS